MHLAVSVYHAALGIVAHAGRAHGMPTTRECSWPRARVAIIFEGDLNSAKPLMPDVVGECFHCNSGTSLVNLAQPPIELNTRHPQRVPVSHQRNPALRVRRGSDSGCDAHAMHVLALKCPPVRKPQDLLEICRYIRDISAEVISCDRIAQSLRKSAYRRHASGTARPAIVGSVFGFEPELYIHHLLLAHQLWRSSDITLDCSLRIQVFDPIDADRGPAGRGNEHSRIETRVLEEKPSY